MTRNNTRAITAEAANELPEWPNIDEYASAGDRELLYQDDLIAALRARLQLAVETLEANRDRLRYGLGHDVGDIIAACREPGEGK